MVLSRKRLAVTYPRPHLGTYILLACKRLRLKVIAFEYYRGSLASGFRKLPVLVNRYIGFAE